MTLYVNVNGTQIEVSPEEEARIRASWETEKARRASVNYKGQRRREYPDIGEQLDALWKIINQLRLEGVNIPQDGDDMLGRILTIKKKHPKPTMESKDV